MNIYKYRPLNSLLVLFSFLHCCNTLLAGRTACAIKPLQIILNDLQWAQESPHHISIYFSALSTSCCLHTFQDNDACLYRTATGVAPFYLHFLCPPEACCTKPVSIANLLILRLVWARFSGSRRYKVTMVTLVCAML